MKGAIKTNLLFVCAGVMCTFWKTRNNFVFNNKLIPSPLVVVYKLVALLKSWTILLGENQRDQVEQMILELSQACGQVRACDPPSFCVSFWVIGGVCVPYCG